MKPSRGKGEMNCLARPLQVGPYRRKERCWFWGHRNLPPFPNNREKYREFPEFRLRPPIQIAIGEYFRRYMRVAEDSRIRE